jgi:hypothetical protein
LGWLIEFDFLFREWLAADVVADVADGLLLGEMGWLIVFFNLVGAAAFWR